MRIDQNETFSFRNTGRETLRLLAVTPMVVWSARAMGVATGQVAAEEAAGSKVDAAERPAPPATTPPAAIEPAARLRETSAAQVQVPQPPPIEDVVPLSGLAEADEPEAPLPDISGLVKRASELPVGPRPERRRPAPEPGPAAQPAPDETEEQEEEEAPSNLMELLAVFDGGSRGNPGQGYGSFLVQSPNRKPVIKRVDFGDNYTNNQAEYDSLIACLNYIIERLEVTNRSPSVVQLEIKTDSDLVANQLLGNFKVKDAGLRKRHAQALELLDRFALWSIEWQPREETVKLLGH